MLTETHKKNWAGQHSELLYWTSNGQFKSKMTLPLEKVSKIPLRALTKGSAVQTPGFSPPAPAKKTPAPGKKTPAPAENM